MIIELKSVGKIFPKSQFRLDDISFNRLPAKLKS